VAILLPAEREATDALLNAIGYVDVLIPRGSQGLIDHVRFNSKVPVIETGAGIVHTYFDEFADLEKGSSIIFNAKTRRVSVCNALDCLIVHYTRLRDLPAMIKPLAEKKVVIYADKTAFMILKGHYPDGLLSHAKPEHFGTEFLSLKMAIKVVESFEEALDHIAAYSSKHSEAIISENSENIEAFLNQVDAAAVYVNASTAFTDGAQFGLGAEIGISTQKLHARGPMGLEELTSYKWIVKGNGQIRTP
jgi:glutamate-5-semialdehyde dehydrogenase